MIKPEINELMEEVRKRIKKRGILYLELYEKYQVKGTYEKKKFKEAIDLIKGYIKNGERETVSRDVEESKKQVSKESTSRQGHREKRKNVQEDSSEGS